MSLEYSHLSKPERIPPEPRRTRTKKQEANLSHEITLENPVIEAFKEIGLPLSQDLRDMFSETLEHRYHRSFVNIRRGSGYMNVGRVLADSMTESETKRQKMLFDEQGLEIISRQAMAKTEEFGSLSAELQQKIQDCWQNEDGAYEKISKLRKQVERTSEIAQMLEEQGADDKRLAKAYYILERQRIELREKGGEIYIAKYKTEKAYDQAFPDGLPKIKDEVNKQVAERVSAAVSKLHNEEDVLVGNIMRDMFYPTDSDAPQLASDATKATERVGSCTTAERYFLEKDSYSQPDVIVDAGGEPVMLYKHAGDSSAVTLKETTLNGVRLPPGSLVAVDVPRHVKKEVFNLDDCRGFRFLRLTTLSVSPRNRSRAFGSAMIMQKEQGYEGAADTSLEYFKDYAQSKLLRNKLQIRQAADLDQESYIF